MILDIDETVGRIGLAMRESCGADLPFLAGYADAKARALVRYADLIASSYASGAIDDEEMRRELIDIAEMSRRVATCLRGHPGAAVERAARAAAATLIREIRAALSFTGAPAPADIAPRDFQAKRAS